MSEPNEQNDTETNEKSSESTIDLPLLTQIRKVSMEACEWSFPQLERQERIDLYETILRGSKREFDFIFLMLIATSIASIGLIQNNVAVVIGAMLLAPLMTPILGVSLSFVQGNRELVICSSLTTLVGFSLGILISVLLGSAFFANHITEEMLARGRPDISDTFIALLSGMAAAYCKSRPHLTSSFAGVAIAAALVPPIATIGLCLSFQEYEIAGNAAILFLTNVFSIILGASLIFFAVGLRSRLASESHDSWVYIYFIKVILLSVLLMFLV